MVSIYEPSRKVSVNERYSEINIEGGLQGVEEDYELIMQHLNEMHRYLTKSKAEDNIYKIAVDERSSMLMYIDRIVKHLEREKILAGILREIQYLVAEMDMETSRDIFRDRLLKKSELKHDRWMKLQSMYIAILQRGLTTIALIAVAIGALTLAKREHLPVPKWLAPVPADTHFNAQGNGSGNESDGIGSVNSVRTILK